MPSPCAPAAKPLLISPVFPSGSDAPQMFGKNQKRNDVQARQEEARLLGARDYKYSFPKPGPVLCEELGLTYR